MKIKITNADIVGSLVMLNINVQAIINSMPEVDVEDLAAVKRLCKEILDIPLIQAIRDED